ncbi:asparaginase [Acetatifactor aquisgranensis]|uniref:asparaginase n=1 Tax=Acetatifactor aquisgranensis TaxID=2941233 RepID=UPI00204148BF|nr:asparaginase [Acetatifactor aquisgranensis]MCI8542767.1 asparaginase [Lachnospiraceae bacterium]
MKKILLIATGGTIASGYTQEGLAPKIAAAELLQYVEGYQDFCRVDVVQPFGLDSTNIYGKHWLELADLIEYHYNDYDGFVICHGTDTMAFTAAALSYLVQNSRKPVVVTGAQKPINLPITDARTNLLDSLRFASEERAYDVNIVFGGNVIAGTRAKKERSKSYNAFSSINYPNIATIRDGRVVFYIEDKDRMTGEVTFYHKLNERILLLKLMPGMDGMVLDRLFPYYDGVIIEAFGVGGLPDYGQTPFYSEIRRWIDAGKLVMMATQVTHEGSDMEVYQVGKAIKEEFHLMETYDMTLEATVTKVMWVLGQTREPEQFRRLFYETINHDILLKEM